MQQLATKLKGKTLDFWALATSWWPSLTVTDYGACDLALTAYANAMASNLGSIGDGEFDKAA